MADALLCRSGLILKPSDGLSEEELVLFPEGRDLLCSLKKVRSARNLRHYYACLTALAKGLGLEAPTTRGKYALDQMLRIECGLVTAIKTQAGGLRLVADSIAFDKLKGGEPEFVEYKRRAFKVCEINFGVDPATLTREGNDLLGKERGS